MSFESVRQFLSSYTRRPTYKQKRIDCKWSALITTLLKTGETTTLWNSTYEITHRRESIVVNKQLKIFDTESFFKNFFPNLGKELSTFRPFACLFYVPCSEPLGVVLKEWNLFNP